MRGLALVLCVFTGACSPPPPPAEVPTIRLGTAIRAEVAVVPVFEVPAPWTQVDVGWLQVQARGDVGATGTIEIDLQDDENLAVMIVGSPGAVVGLHDLIGPEGVLIDPSDNDAGTFERALSRGFVGAWRSVGRTVVGDEQALVVWPSSTVTVEAGTYTLSLVHAAVAIDGTRQASLEPVWLSVWRRSSSLASARLPITIHLSSLRQSLPEWSSSSVWRAAEQQSRASYAAVGVELDIDLVAAAEPRFAEITLGDDCRGGELGELLQVHSDDGARAHVFLVDDILCGTPGLLGISSALPGVAHRSDGAGSGIVIALPIGDEGRLGVVMGHELGHLLGLFHTRENDAFSPDIADPIEDTPDDEGAADNLMYFRIDNSTGTSLTPEQGQIIRQHPWMMAP